MCALSNHLKIVLQKIAPGNLRESGETKCTSGCTVLLLVTRTYSLERTAKSFGSLRGGWWSQREETNNYMWFNQKHVNYVILYILFYWSVIVHLLLSRFLFVYWLYKMQPHFDWNIIATFWLMYAIFYQSFVIILVSCAVILPRSHFYACIS